jgi:4-amino-4-deoxy-L-arabinose transferase-like glycosyltransferase
VSATAPTTGSHRAALRALAARLARPAWPGVRARVAVYALVLVGLGGWVCFSRLGEGMLACDEASFAYTSDRMVRTGDWVVPHIHELGPHLNAAPLYNWLTNLTGPLAGDGYARYRVWSAVFGVGCALAALALGALLFGAEVGFLAGLFLLANVSFVFQHGARASVMEAGLAFLVTTMAVCYVRTFQAPHRARLWWALTGVFLGLAVLMKPPAMGGFFFCTLCLHHLVARRDLSWKARLLGPLGAGAVAALIS